MDSTQDPFTRRMLQRASMRQFREESLHCSPDQLQRKMSILRAINDKPAVKIGDRETISRRNTSENKFADDKPRILRRTSVTLSDSLIRQRDHLPIFYPINRYSSSDLTDQSKSTPEYQNLRYHQRRVNGKVSQSSIMDNESSDSQVFSKTSKIQKDQKRIKSNNTAQTPEAACSYVAKPRFRKLRKRKEDEVESDSDLSETSNSTSITVTENSTKDKPQSAPTYIEGFKLGNVKWRGPLHDAYATKNLEREKADDFSDKSIDDREAIKRHSSCSRSEEPKLLKTLEREISIPPKMTPELRTIGDSKQKAVNDKVEGSPAKTSANKRPDKLSLEVTIAGNSAEKKCSTNPEVLPDSPTTPLTAEIRRLNADIGQLKFHSDFYTPENDAELSPPVRLYPNLSKIPFTPTGYTPKKLYRSPYSPEQACAASLASKSTSSKNRLNFNENPTSTRNDEPPNNIAKPATSSSVSESVTTNNGGPTSNLDKEAKTSETKCAENNRDVKKNDGFKLNLESTRKSLLTNLSKIMASGPRHSQSIASSSSTTAPNSPEGLGSPPNASSPKDKTLNSTIPYDVDHFLADALGNELYNTTMTFPPSEGNPKSYSEFCASDLISAGTTSGLNNSSSAVRKTQTTESPPPYTSTFNRGMTIYRSFTQSIKNKLRPGLKSLPKNATNDAVTTVEMKSDDRTIQALFQDASIQQTIMYQANKALTFCHSMKEFSSSTEQVESERSLLVAGLRKEAILEEIKRRQNSQQNNNVEEPWERGEVTIKNFSLPLKEDILEFECRTGDFVQWFVIAVSQGPTVWATRPISCPVQSPRIIFPDSFFIANLPPNFKITIRIYCLKLRRTTFNHDDKYHLNKAERQATCPSPKKLILRRSDRPLSPGRQRHIESVPIRNTSFVLSGMVELYLHDLSLTSPWPLTSLLTGSVLYGTIDLTLSSKLQLSVYHAGFLTHGDEAGGFAAWNRRWCVLQNQTLMFWNYPCDQEEKQPLATIDLSNCTSPEINAVDRSMCAKPRTLLIETFRERNVSDRNSMLLECRLSCTVIRNLLCCDTLKDLNLWKSKINRVVSALRDWNVNRRFPYEQVSDL
ncbi:anillin-like [Neodiprion pinetum]|uniref:anillin-like n=1 Tax=Neodiprion pinetum TaxID=441929 RepID=UPI001EE0A72A|nr:anillin-like protein 1 [Neodiprion pinetum]